MYRLIYKEADGDLTCNSRDFDKVFQTLFDYEETGMTPVQIQAMKDHNNALLELKDAYLSELDKIKVEHAAEVAALRSELRDERHRHDRYVDFELGEAEELRRLKELWAQVPATIKEQINWIFDGEFAKDNNVPTREEA